MREAGGLKFILSRVPEELCRHLSGIPEGHTKGELHDNIARGATRALRYCSVGILDNREHPCDIIHVAAAFN